MDTQTFDAFVFDLDGTLLNTLPDLVSLTNATLAEFGYPQHSTEQIRSFVGNGARALMYQAVPKGASEEDIDRAMARWKELYPQFGYGQTKPYEGMPQTLAELKRRGKRLGALSNKFDEAARQVVAGFLPDTFDIVHGECPEYPRKPNPAGLLKMLKVLGVDPSRCAYIGDSGGDMTTAVNAQVFGIGVSWGYQSVRTLKDNGARAIIDEPRQLLQWA